MFCSTPRDASSLFLMLRVLLNPITKVKIRKGQAILLFYDVATSIQFLALLKSESISFFLCTNEGPLPSFSHDGYLCSTPSLLCFVMDTISARFLIASGKRLQMLEEGISCLFLNVAKGLSIAFE